MLRRRGAIPVAELGPIGERRALWYFRLRGYRIVARNVRLRRGEIDLIVRRGRTLVFVEVKTRQSLAAVFRGELVHFRPYLSATPY